RPSSFDNVVPVSSVATPAGSGYLWPTDAKIITQYYTWQHNGLDIASRVGTRIYATKAGTITVSQCGWNTGYGCYIKIDHGNGLTSLYGHNSQLLVNVGDYVTQGQNIALMGSTGNSSGSHVHFEIRVNNNNVNPLSYVRKP
ncbi:MAG: membrane protein, partial [uncultured bacterium]